MKSQSYSICLYTQLKAFKVEAEEGSTPSVNMITIINVVKALDKGPESVECLNWKQNSININHKLNSWHHLSRNMLALSHSVSLMLQ